MGSSALTFVNIAVTSVVNFLASIVGTGSGAVGDVTDTVFGSLGQTPRP